MEQKLKVLDLFAGAGGFSLGFEMSNFDIMGCMEIDKWACDTLRYNKNCKVIEADIRNFTSKYSIKANHLNLSSKYCFSLVSNQLIK